MSPPDKAARRAKWWAETKTDLKWVTVLLFVLILSVSAWLWSGQGAEGLPTADRADWRGPTDGEESLSNVTGEIFGQTALVVPFEILSVLLLAALIAGVVIALREPENKGGR